MELLEKKAKGIRDGIKEAKVIADLGAGDAVKKAARDNMNSTALYKTYGVQENQRSVSQSVGQSVN